MLRSIGQRTILTCVTNIDENAIAARSASMSFAHPRVIIDLQVQKSLLKTKILRSQTKQAAIIHFHKQKNKQKKGGLSLVGENHSGRCLDVRCKHNRGALTCNGGQHLLKRTRCELSRGGTPVRSRLWPVYEGKKKQ